MDEEKLKRAGALEKEAAKLRKESFDERPLPKYWRVGQKVRFLESVDWAWTRGAVWTIVKVRNPRTPAAEYQVFWTSPDGGKSQFWTTPKDVELVEDVMFGAPAMSNELIATYDERSDVLYITTRPGVPALSKHGHLGLVLRYDVGTHEPIGMTVLDFSEFWRHRADQLIDEIAAHLHTPRQAAFDVVHGHWH